MGPNDDKERMLSDVGEQILTALDDVAQSAERAVAHGPSGVSRTALVNASNLMVGDAKPEKRIEARNAEERAILRQLMDEPFVARVDVDWSSEGRPVVETFYFPRRYTGGLGITGALRKRPSSPWGARRIRSWSNRFHRCRWTHA